VGSIGFPEIAVIVVIALLVLGPDRLPGAARQVGQALAQLRNMSAGLKRDFEEAVDGTDLRQTFDDIKSTVDELNPRRVVQDALSPNTFTMASGDVVEVTTGANGSVSVIDSAPPPSSILPPDADVQRSADTWSANGLDPDQPSEPADDPFLKAFPHIPRADQTPAPVIAGNGFVDILMDES
jgi:sec-independent protein translocase protein TatB